MKRDSERIVQNLTLALVCVGFLALGGVIWYFMQSGHIQSEVSGASVAGTSSMLANYDLDEMIALSDLIVSGQVKDVSDPFRDGENADIIRRRAVFQADEVFQGDNADSIMILLTGGTIGDSAQGVSEAVKLEVGDSLILFLVQYRDSDDYVVLNATQGALFAQPSENLNDDTEYRAKGAFKFDTTTKRVLRDLIQNENAQ